MRVKLGNRIYFCTLATYAEYSKAILLTTSNGIYVVDVKSPAQAKYCHTKLLIDGYYDFSAYEYSN